MAEGHRSYWSPEQFFLKGKCTDLLGLTASELQCWTVASKDPGKYEEELNCLASE